MSIIQVDMDPKEEPGLYDKPSAVMPSVDLSVLSSFEDPDTTDASGLVVELIDLYQKEATRLLETMRQGIETKDWSVVKRAAHSLRGSSGNLGVLRMACVCDRMEHSELSHTLATQLLQDLEEEFVHVGHILVAERQRRCGANTDR
ncbi:MAG TPA: Hpt domain-containing protein [Pyrinomonadaceae bacterium]|jgi:HPt (histidine-containing phosphotransfer) domain-containing protein|nr:Hpt domain-containing protein [Pyrinomonadaceae bacterium]